MIRLIILGFLILWGLSGRAQLLTATQTAEGVWIFERGKKVLFYQAKTKDKDGKWARSNYIHPLYGLDGAVLTEDFPEDHLHHRGIFWAWHQVLIGDKAIGDAWECRDFKWELAEISTQPGEKGEISLLTKTFWKSPDWKDAGGVELPFLEEHIRLTVFPAEKNYRILDFEISLRALAPNLKIGGSEDEKGYGGFSIRMKTPEDLRFTSVDGALTPKTEAMHAGPWLDIQGALGADGSSAGIRIIPDPGNPMAPQPWILRKAESMQNVVYPGRRAVEISTTKPTVLKYRLVVYNGEKAHDFAP